MARNQRKHGMRGSPVYSVWKGMRRRCFDENHKDYHSYGGRGIRPCSRWDDFANFHADMGSSYRQGLTLERIDVNEGYSPENCKWIPASEQCLNLRQTVNVTIFGVTKCKTHMARLFGLDRRTVDSRLNRGWGKLDAYTTPIRGTKTSELSPHSAELEDRVSALKERPDPTYLQL